MWPPSTLPGNKLPPLVGGMAGGWVWGSHGRRQRGTAFDDKDNNKKKCSVLFKLFLWYWHGQTHAVLRWQRFAHDAQVLRQKDLSWHMSLSSWTAELHEWHWNAPLVAVIELPAIDWSGSPSLLMTTLYSSAPWLVRHWLWVSELFAVAAAWQNTSMQFLGGLLVRDGTVTHSWNYWMASHCWQLDDLLGTFRCLLRCGPWPPFLVSFHVPFDSPGYEEAVFQE